MFTKSRTRTSTGAPGVSRVVMLYNHPFCDPAAKILIEDSAWALLQPFRQSKAASTEAGGIFLGYRRGPHLHIVDATASDIVKAGFGTVGLLGTRFTMQQPFYRDRLAAAGYRVSNFYVVSQTGPSTTAFINGPAGLADKTGSIDATVVSNITWTCPPIISVSAGPDPR